MSSREKDEKLQKHMTRRSFRIRKWINVRKITRLSHSQPKREFPSFYIFPCWIHLRMWMNRKETRTFLAINAFCFQTHSDSFANLHFPFINCVWRKKIFFIFPVDDKVAGASRTKLLELLSMLRWFIVLSSSFTKVRLAVNLLSLEWRHEWKKHFLLPASQRSVGFWNYQRVDTHNSHSRRRFDIKISSSSFFLLQHTAQWRWRRRWICCFPLVRVVLTPCRRYEKSFPSQWHHQKNNNSTKTILTEKTTKDDDLEE